MTLEMFLPIFPIVAGVAGVVWLVDYVSATMVRADGSPRREWTARRTSVWATVGSLTFGAALVSFIALAAAIEVRDGRIIEAALEDRYGVALEDIADGRGSVNDYWTVGGVPAACEVFGDLPHNPYMYCVGIVLKPVTGPGS